MSTEFTIVKKGYDPAEVDEYVNKLEEVITSYKEKDVSIKNAIISAQIAADNIVKNAEAEAREIVSSAENEAETRRVEAYGILADLRQDVKRQKNTIKGFQEDYNNMMKKYFTDFNNREFLALFDKINEIEESLLAFKDKSSEEVKVNTNNTATNTQKEANISSENRPPVKNFNTNKSSAKEIAEEANAVEKK